MLYLLDTDVVSNLRRKKPHPALLSWLQSVPPLSVFMAATTVAEIQCGVGLVADPGVAGAVQAWLDGMVRNGHPQVADFDVHAGLLLGRMWTTASLNNFIAADPRSKKQKSGSDLTIAAIAIARGMIMVTANVDDFLAIDAAFSIPGIFDPLNGHWAVGAAG